MLSHGFRVPIAYPSLGEQPLLDCLVSASATCNFDIPVEGLLLIHGSFLEVLKIEMLQGNKFVGFCLVNLIVLEPSNLKHAFKGLKGDVIIFFFLVYAANFFVNQDSFFVKISVFDKVSKVVKYLHGLLMEVHLLKQQRQHESEL